MKRLFAIKPLLGCVLVLCAAGALAQEKLPPQFGPLRILEVGINGEYVSGQPTSVRLQISNPLPQSLRVELRLDSQFEDPNHRAYGNEDTFIKPVTLNPNEQRELELPVILPYANQDMRFEAAAVAASGQVLAYDRVGGKKLTTRGAEGSVGVLCVTDQVCKEAQQQAQFSGTMEERVDKNKKLHFVILREPRAQWFAYTVVQALVLAAPMRGYTDEQRKAIEDYVRRGGRLVLLENEIADPSFLAAYRQKPAGEAVRVSRGKLYRMAGLQSQQLGGIFTGGTLTELLAASPAQFRWPPYGQDPEMAWLRRHAATQFVFPRLRWLLIWLTIYVIVIGLVNFAVLRRLRRLEWGWITILAGALLFAAGFYISSSRQRPQQFTLDDLAVYWMDDHSANAFGEYGLRVSAPQRQTVTLKVMDGTAVWSTGFHREPSRVDIGAEIRERRVTPGIDIRLGPPQELEVALLRWSFADHNFEGPRRFAGSLRQVAPGKLRNETGVELRAAMFVDYEAKQVWNLGTLAPGTEVSLANIAAKELYEKTKDQQQAQPAAADPNQRAPMIEVARYTDRLGRRVAFALSGSPTIAVELAGTSYARNNEALLVVVFE